MSDDGTSFDTAIRASSVANQPQYEMFDNRDVPFYGDYNWIQLVERSDGSLFGYLSWTDTDMVRGADQDAALRDMRNGLPSPASKTTGVMLMER